MEPARHSAHTLRALVLAALLVLLAPVASSAWQATPQPRPFTLKALEEKRIPFHMEAQPWRKVFRWLAGQTELPFGSAEVPRGTFTFVSPKTDKGPRLYSIPEEFRILNEALAPSDWMLLPPRGAIRLASPEDPRSWPHAFTPEELPYLGQKRIVLVELPLTALEPKATAAKVNTLLSRSGELAAGERSLRVWDTAVKLQEMLEAIARLEEPFLKGAIRHTQQCVYIRAADARAALERFPGTHLGQMGLWLSLVVDRGANSLTLRGPAERVARAREALAQIDKGTEPLGSALPFLQMHFVPFGRAEALAEFVNRAYRHDPDFRGAAHGPDTLWLFADAAFQRTVARCLREALPLPVPAAEFIPLPPTLDPERVVITMSSGQRWDTPPEGWPVITADTTRHAIVVKGTKRQIEEVKGALSVFGGEFPREDPPPLPNPPRVLVRGRQGPASSEADAAPITPGELEARKPTDIVQVRVPLIAANAKELLADTKALLGRSGEAVAVGNDLLLRDVAGNLRNVGKILTRLDESAQKGAARLVYRCLHVHAADAQATLDRFLGGRRGQQGLWLTVAADLPANTLTVRGPAERVALARKTLVMIDVPGPEPVGGPPVLQTHSVPFGRAEVVAAILNQAHRNDPRARAAAIGPNAIILHGSRPIQQAVALQLRDPFALPVATQFIPVGPLDAAKLVETLRQMFCSDGREKGPILFADTARNGIIVKGTKEQIEDVKAALGPLPREEPMQEPQEAMRIMHLEEGHAPMLVDVLEHLLPQMCANPVQVVVAGRKEAPAPPPREQEKPGGKALPPVTITVFGNRLIVNTADPKAMALVMELVRAPLPRTDEGDFEVIRLRHARAEAVARTLDEVFNGPRQGEGPAKGGAAKAEPRTERIRVVADPATNTLLLKANPPDLLTIRRLLERVLDTPPVHAPAPLRTRVIGPLKHARAAEIAPVLHTVFGGERLRGGVAAPKEPLAVAVDARTNSLVIRCSPALEAEIVALVEQIDRKAAHKKP